MDGIGVLRGKGIQEFFGHNGWHIVFLHGVEFNYFSQLTEESLMDGQST